MSGDRWKGDPLQGCGLAIAAVIVILLMVVAAAAGYWSGHS